MAVPGCLWVLIEPSEALPVSEYNDWYDHEHLPLRAGPQGIHGFLAGVRWLATDQKLPAFQAVYNLSSLDVLTGAAYVELSANSSEREKSVMKRFATVDRREGTLDGEVGAAGPGGFMATVVFPKGAEVTGKELAGVSGWVRSSWIQLTDPIAPVKGTSTRGPIEGEAKAVFYEFREETYLASSEWRAFASDKPEIRTWKLHGGYVGGTKV